MVGFLMHMWKVQGKLQGKGQNAKTIMDSDIWLLSRCWKLNVITEIFSIQYLREPLMKEQRKRGGCYSRCGQVKINDKQSIDKKEY